MYALSHLWEKECELIESQNVTSEPAEKASKKSKKNEGKDSEPTSAASSEVEDAVMPAESVSSNVERPEEDFTSIYLRKITTELADDLDKVREANDFTNRSLPMLIHALKQGESIFSAEEKRRVIGTSGM